MKKARFKVGEKVITTREIECKFGITLREGMEVEIAQVNENTCVVVTPRKQLIGIVVNKDGLKKIKPTKTK